MELDAISDVFQTLAELAISIAGFSGIVLVFAEQPDDLRGEDKIRIFQLLSTSISTMLLALIPNALDLMGYEGTTLWRISSGFALGIYVALVGVYFRLLSHLDEVERQNLIGTTAGRILTAIVIAVCTLGSLALLALNVTALGFGGEQWPYFLVVLWGVVMSAGYLVLIILIRPQKAT